MSGFSFFQWVVSDYSMDGEIGLLKWGGGVVLEAQADVNITIFPNDLGSMSWFVILYQAKK